MIGNNDLPAPQISSATQTLVQGTACTTCTVEVFIAQTNDSFDTNEGGEGKTYLGQGATDGAGNFSIAVSGVTVGDEITGTATDALGNTSEFGLNVTATDGEPPVGTVLLNGGTGLISVYPDVLAEFEAADGTAVTGWRHWKDSESPPGSYTNISPTPSFSTQIDPMTLSEGLHTVYAQYIDTFGNESVVASATITIQNIGDPTGDPDYDPDNGQIIINNGAPYTNNPNLSLKLIAPLPPFYTKEMKVGEDTPSGNPWEPYALNKSWPLSGPPANSQIVTMAARFRDADDTNTPSDVSDTILFDPVAPTPSVGIDINTKVLNLSGSHDDAGGSGLGQMRIYDGVNHDSGWIAYQTSYPWPGPAGTIINVKLKDNVGNESGVASVGLPIPGPPTGSIILNGGSIQSSSNDVPAQFFAIDDGAVKHWRFWNDDESVPNWTQITPAVSPFEESETLNLPDGFHTVYVQYKDDEGLVSVVYSASVVIGDLPKIYLPIIMR